MDGNHPTFPSSRIFSPKWPFRYRCRSEEERIFLTGRIRHYVYNHRRGNFKLPVRFRDLEAEVSKLTKSQLRQQLFTFKVDRALDCELDQHTIEWSGMVMPQTIWRPPKLNLDAAARQVDTHRLAEREWPRDARSLWPSFPSISEIVGMAGQGKTPSGLWSHRIRIGNPVTMKHSHDNHKIATRMILRNVVGVRSTVPIPRKFLPWFRYRNGFLILSVRYNLPIGLVRLLTSSWIRSPYNFWLQVPCRYKSYLRLYSLDDCSPSWFS